VTVTKLDKSISPYMYKGADGLIILLFYGDEIEMKILKSVGVEEAEGILDEYMDAYGDNLSGAVDKVTFQKTLAASVSGGFASRLYAAIYQGYSLYNNPRFSWFDNRYTIEINEYAESESIVDLGTFSLNPIPACNISGTLWSSADNINYTGNSEFQIRLINNANESTEYFPISTAKTTHTAIANPSKINLRLILHGSSEQYAAVNGNLYLRYFELFI